MLFNIVMDLFQFAGIWLAVEVLFFAIIEIVILPRLNRLIPPHEMRAPVQFVNKMFDTMVRYCSSSVLLSLVLEH